MTIPSPKSSNLRDDPVIEFVKGSGEVENLLIKTPDPQGSGEGQMLNKRSGEGSDVGV